MVLAVATTLLPLHLSGLEQAERAASTATGTAASLSASAAANGAAAEAADSTGAAARDGATQAAVTQQTATQAAVQQAAAQRRAARFARGRVVPPASANNRQNFGAAALQAARLHHAGMANEAARRATDAARVGAELAGSGPTANATSLSTAWQAVGPMQVSTAMYGLVTGRVTAVAIDPADTTGNTVYLGTTGGGVWKSTNANGAASSVSFTPLTDTLQVFSPNAASSATTSISIGAMSVQPGGTGVLLAGTGDPNDATDSYYGEGILRSADGGTTWTLVQQSNDGAAGNHSFQGEGFAGFAWSTTNTGLVVAAVSSSAEDAFVGGSLAGASARGLYFSTDAGVTWQMATIRDGAQTVQSPADNFSAAYQGNAATAVTWNPVRRTFVAAVRFHGYYESTDGQTWTREAVQPGASLTAAACPARPGTTGLTNCPIFRGAVAAQPVSGDMFALTVDGNNNDVGLYQDLCTNTGSACASGTVLWAGKLNSTPLENGSGAIAQGDYNLALSVVPAATARSMTDTLVFAGVGDLFRCTLSDVGGCSLRNTTNATTGCAAPAKVAPYQHAIAYQVNLADTAAPLLFFGNDGGLWRSSDGVNQQATSCSADDATHFDNLNGALGSLAEVDGLSTHPTDGGIGLVALGALGSAASTTSSSTGAFQSVWAQMGTGESGNVAIDQANPANWLLQSGAGVSLYLCTKGAACTAADFTGPPAIGVTQVNGDAELADAPVLLDPALNTNVIVGTCRVYRGPTTGGTSWSSANELSTPLSGPAGAVCGGTNGLIRSIGAGGQTVLTSNAATSGSPVLYAGLAGTNDGGSNAFGGHFYKTTQGNLASGATPWTDVTAGTVTNDTANVGRFNPGGFDVSGISLDPNDPTGRTVYATIMGFNSPTVYRSTDGAASWVSVTANLPNAPANAVVVDPNDSNVVYVAMDTGVYVTTNVMACATANAQCWSIYGTALPNAPVTKLVASVAFALPGSAGVGVLRAGTYGRGIWQIPLITAGQSARPVATVSPTSLSFGTQTVGTTSAAQTVTVTNTGNAALAVSRVSASTGWVETDVCAGVMVAPGATCTVQVLFAPSTAGAQTGTLQVYGNVLGGYASVALTGNGTGMATVLLSPASVTFADTVVKANSAAQTVTVTNNGSLAATLQMPMVTGDFQLAASTCASTLAPAASCALSVTFAPTASGLRTGLLQVIDNTGTHTVPLSGNGIAGVLTASPTALQFADTPVHQASASKTIAVLNNGNGPLQLGSLTVSGDFTESDSCANTTLAAGRSCNITVTFVPTSAGTRTGTMVIASNANGTAGSTTTIALSGNGQGAFDVVLTPVMLDFGTAFVSATTAVQNISISNTGVSIGKLGAATVSGDFVLKANTCGATLASQTGCTVSIAFAPTATGTRTGTFSLTDDDGVQTAVLTGVGTAAATDTLTPLSLSFGPTVVSTSSTPQTVSLTNNGDVALTLVAAKITAGDFSAVNGCGPSLPAHSSCGISVVFSPKAVGSLTGTLEVDDVQRAQLVPLTGTSTAGVGVSVSPTSLSFAATGVGNATSAQSVTLTNNGTSPLTLSGVTVSGDFGLIAGNSGGGCALGVTLPVQASCTLQVAFAPRSAGARTGTLSLTSNAPAQTVMLGGQGIDFSFASNGPASVTVVSGKSATFPLLLTPAVSSSLPVTYTCTGAPTNAKCTVTSQYGDLSATSTVSAVIQTGITIAVIRPEDRPRIGEQPKAGSDLLGKVWWALLLPLGLAGVAHRRGGLQQFSCLLALLLVFVFGSGCGSGRKTADAGTGIGTGGGSGGSTATTPTGSYNVVVSVTGAGLTRQVPLTLIVTAQ